MAFGVEGSGLCFLLQVTFRTYYMRHAESGAVLEGWKFDGSRIEVQALASSVSLKLQNLKL